MEKTSLQKVGSCWGFGGGFLRQAKIRKNTQHSKICPSKKSRCFFFLGDLMIPDNSLSDLPPGMLFLPLKVTSNIRDTVG